MNNIDQSNESPVPDTIVPEKIALKHFLYIIVAQKLKFL